MEITPIDNERERMAEASATDALTLLDEHFSKASKADYVAFCKALIRRLNTEIQANQE